MEAVRSLDVAAAPVAAEAPEARIGPNAVIQLAAALRARLGKDGGRRVFAVAGHLELFHEPPQEMVAEATAAALYRALFSVLPAELAADVAADAGTRTADYVLANRIPMMAQRVLKTLPVTVAGPLLLKAITRNAWTFAGSGQVRTQSCGHRFTVEITANPMAMPGCAWHQAVFQRLFSVLVSPDVTVRHPSCCHDGATLCRFEITAA